jgi:predicted nucleic acid-binding protein
LWAFPGFLLVIRVYRQATGKSAAEASCGFQQHARPATRFFRATPKVVTCPITELNLVRVLMQKGHTPSEASRTLADFVSKHRSKLIPADISATAISDFDVGHRTTTDSYLAMLARKHGVKIATLDEPFSKRFPGLVQFVGGSTEGK